MRNRNRSLDYKDVQIQSNDWSLNSNTPKQIPFQVRVKKPKQESDQFVNILEERRKKMFNQFIREARGRNNPIRYSNQYEFLQRWETLNKENDFHNVNYQMPENVFGLIFNVVELLQKIVVVWFLSIYRLYDLKNIHWPFILGLMFVLINCIWKSVITAKHYISIKLENNPNFNSSQHLRTLFHTFAIDVYMILYYVVTLFYDGFHQGFLGFIILDYLTALFQYYKGQSLYKRIKLFGIRSAYRNYMNLFDLMSNLFVVFHFCAIMIYSLTLYCENNWLESIHDHPTDNWYSRYIYSVYFTSTTMLTVGYGDILPTNKLQICIILLIQILGTAINGYIFSQVGHTLAKIRYKKQTQQKDISDTEKLAKVYRLDSQLAKKMRQYIVNNEMQNQQLNIEEENNLLLKLNDQLRTQVNNFNHMQIIKQNIFFLFYFSKKAQIQFAKRLQRRLLSPNESIYQILGKEKLFIVTKGRLEIYTDRKQGMRFYCKKKLKEIIKIDKKEISDNIFGYSSIIWGKPTNLRAISKDFTVIYNLEKSQMLEVINDDSNDLESFFELKERIILEKFPQRWQVPRITSIREHYAPSMFFLIKKQRSKLKRLIQKERKPSIRSDRRCKTIKPLVAQNFQNNSDNQSSEQSFHSDENIVPIDETSNKVICIEERKEKYTKIKELEKSQNTLKSIVPRSYKRKYVNNKKYEQRHKEELIQKWQYSKDFEQSQLNFEVAKNFNCFFKKRNLASVITKLNKKDTIQTQLTMIETMGPFRPRRPNRVKLSCNI